MKRVFTLCMLICSIYCVNAQVTLAVEDFDGGMPAWSNDVASQVFVDPNSSNQGLFIEAGTGNIPTESGNIAHGQDLGGESGEPTLSPFTFTFSDVNVAGYNMIVASFDFAAFANADAGEYEWVIDGVGQGQVEFFNDPDMAFVSGTITNSIGTATTVGLILTGTLNGGSDVLDLDNFIITGVEIPSPIQLNAFDATQKDQSVELSWETQTEENNDIFQIEHSIDGREYSKIGTVNGAGTSYEVQNYSFMHDDVASGIHYYRLQQIDFDGQFSYSPVQVVRILSNKEILVRPTLATASVDLVVEKPFDYDTQIAVYSITGQKMMETVFQAGEINATLDVANLNSGNYIVRLNTNNGAQTVRFVKL